MHSNSNTRRFHLPKEIRDQLLKLKRQHKNFKVDERVLFEIVTCLRLKLCNNLSDSVFTKGESIVGITEKGMIKFGFHGKEFACSTGLDAKSCLDLEKFVLKWIEILVIDSRAQSLLFMKRFPLQMIPSVNAVLYGNQEDIMRLVNISKPKSKGFLFGIAVIDLESDTIFENLINSFSERSGNPKFEFAKWKIRKLLDSVHFPKDVWILMCHHPESGLLDFCGRARRIGEESHVSARKALFQYFSLEIPIRKGPALLISETEACILHNLSFSRISNAYMKNPVFLDSF